MNEYTVTLPDGSTETRKTKKNYEYVVFVKIGNGGWFACFSSSLKGAIATERKYENCPAVKQGANVETKMERIAK